jgi:hypothetical protein
MPYFFRKPKLKLILVIPVVAFWSVNSLIFLKYEEQSSIYYAQVDSWLMDITEGDDFLGLGDQKFRINMKVSWTVTQLCPL